MQKEVLFFRNGNTAVLMDDGEQAPELQRPWLVLFAEFLQGRGLDPTEFVYRTPDTVAWELFRTGEGGFNWRRADGGDGMRVVG